MDRDYSIAIQLSDPNNQVTGYVLSVRVECEPLKEWEAARGRSSNPYELRYDSNPPVPFIHSISVDGLVRIRFNATMSEAAALTEEELNPPT